MSYLKKTLALSHGKYVKSAENMNYKLIEDE